MVRLLLHGADHRTAPGRDLRPQAGGALIKRTASSRYAVPSTRNGKPGKKGPPQSAFSSGEYSAPQGGCI